MTLPFSLFLALKYLKPKRTFLSVVTVLSTLGVLLGVAVLIIVLSVMDRLRRDVAGKDPRFQFPRDGFRPGRLRGGGRRPLRANRSRAGRRRRRALPAEPRVLQKPNGQVETPLIRGVDPVREARVSRIPASLVAGEFNVADGAVVLGSDLARRLGVGVGDALTVYSPATFMDKDEIRLPTEMTVAGIFEMGMWEFDMGYLVASLWDARDFCGGTGLEAIQVMTTDPYAADQVAAEIRRRLGPGVHVTTWMDQKPAALAALRVEKNMMFFLLIFITIVAAFGITNTLITVTVQKTREIGLLRSLGFSAGGIMRVFFWQAGSKACWAPRWASRPA
jgi:lipoprotein-releasing system permease protein